MNYKKAERRGRGRPEESPAETIRALRAQIADRVRENQELAGSYKKLATEVKAANLRAEKAEKKAQPTDLDRFHKLHTWCQPAAAALTAIAVASSRYTISRVVGGDDAGIEGIHWLIANGIGYGIPLAIMPFLYWSTLSKSSKLAFLWLFLIASAAIFLLGVIW